MFVGFRLRPTLNGYVRHIGTLYSKKSLTLWWSQWFKINLDLQLSSGYTVEARMHKASPSDNMQEGRDKKRSIGEAGK